MFNHEQFTVYFESARANTQKLFLVALDSQQRMAALQFDAFGELSAACCELGRRYCADLLAGRRSGDGWAQAFESGLQHTVELGRIWTDVAARLQTGVTELIAEQAPTLNDSLLRLQPEWPATREPRADDIGEARRPRRAAA